MSMTIANLSRYMDAAILKPETTTVEMEEAVALCVANEAFAVVVKPADVPRAVELCSDSATLVCAVVSFPFGAELTSTKVASAEQVIAAGAREIDLVANYGWARSGRWAEVEQDIAAVVAVAHGSGVPVKVIIETAQLDADQIKAFVEVCVRAGADFVKSSTGFNGPGAQEDDIQLMLDTAGDRIQVKPAGGIRDHPRAEMFVAMGTQRLGINWTSCREMWSVVAP